MTLSTLGPVAAYLEQAGYLPAEIGRGVRYAIQQGATTNDETLSHALARILYADEDLEDGETYPVEPGSIEWSDFAPKRRARR